NVVDDARTSGWCDSGGVRRSERRLPDMTQPSLPFSHSRFFLGLSGTCGCRSPGPDARPRELVATPRGGSKGAVAPLASDAPRGEGGPMRQHTAQESVVAPSPYVERIRPNAELPFRQVLEVLPVAAYTCDPEGLITSFNQRAQVLWGREPALNDPA